MPRPGMPSVRGGSFGLSLVHGEETGEPSNPGSVRHTATGHVPYQWLGQVDSTDFARELGLSLYGFNLHQSAKS